LLLLLIKFQTLYF